ncbi:hypothetical protein AMTRI_Chr09g39180 [Amborella trichopoda]
MAATMTPENSLSLPEKRQRYSEGDDNHDGGKKKMAQSVVKKPRRDPAEALASARHEFGEHGGVNMSIEASATFTVMEPETMSRMFKGELGPDRDFFIYSRHFNPTVLNLGRAMAALEATEAAYCTASGLSAISSVLLQLCPSGSHIVASPHLYGGTHALLSSFLPRSCNITTTFVDILKPDVVRAAFKPNTRVLIFETISNPTLVVADVAQLSSIAREFGASTVVDNTFAPMIVSPVSLGADVVVHSLTKYASGCADLIAGAVCGPEKLINSMMDVNEGALMLLGPSMDPKVAFEIAGRLPHLGLRMREHCRRALIYATRMRELGLKVIYPGLPDHPQHSMLKQMANEGYGFGGVLCVDMETVERANRLMHFLQNCTQFGLIAVSLGYYETLMSCSGSSTSSEISPEEREKVGLSPGLVRMSIGYSGSLEQRWAQFQSAINRIKQEEQKRPAALLTS